MAHADRERSDGLARCRSSATEPAANQVRRAPETRYRLALSDRLGAMEPSQVAPPSRAHQPDRAPGKALQVMQAQRHSQGRFQRGGDG